MSKCGSKTFLNRHSRVGGNPARRYWIPDQVRNDGFKNGFLETLTELKVMVAATPDNETVRPDVVFAPRPKGVASSLYR